MIFNYGVMKINGGRYLVVKATNDGKYLERTLNLHYAKKDFALKKAEGFYRNVSRHYYGEHKFNNCGEISFDCMTQRLITELPILTE
jgi:hypothetical protein